MNQVLEVRDLTKQYPSFLLDHLSFTLEEEKITGFIGRNGAGKTTTIHSLLGLIHPDDGEIRFWGMHFRENEQKIKQRIGFVSSGMTFYNKQKIGRITSVTREFYENWDEARYRECLKLFSLEESKTPEQLSNGMKIKYLLSLALSHGADLLILDEPTSGLDPVSREELMEIFLNLKDEGKTIFYSTHITSDLDKTADNILYLAGGKLKAAGSMEDVIGAYRVVHYQEMPDVLQGKLIGQRREKNGYSALLPTEEAEKTAGIETAPANLDEIMIHLEKEE